MDMGRARRNHDWRDMRKIMEWFVVHDPFDGIVPQLRYLASGLTALEGDGINCDDTEKVGEAIQRSMDGKSVSKATMKRSLAIHTLDDLRPGIKIDTQIVRIDPSVLFTRCTALAQREDKDILPYFRHEMTAVAASLFKDFSMRKVDKSELARSIQKDLTNIDEAENPLPKHSMHVVDGGWLLHHIRWRKNSTYAQVLEQYSSYIEHRFGLSCIVFDGHENGLSTNDHEHGRRQLGKISANVLVGTSANAHADQEAFLSNTGNKTQLIKLLSSRLQSLGHVTKISEGDADTLIVSPAMAYATGGQAAVVVAEDTDIFVMLLYHYCDRSNDGLAAVFLKKEAKRLRQRQVYSLKEAAEVVPAEVSKRVLVIHAWSGCDTSDTFGHGEPQRLPPTERVAYFHSLRVHLQVVRWRTLNNDELDHNDWGWKEENGSLCPTMTDLDAAPSKVFNFIRCKCKESSKKQCGTKLCSCRKSGLKCVMACQGCRGQICNNIDHVVNDDEETDVDL